MNLPDITKFRELNKELYVVPEPGTSYNAIYYMKKISGTPKEKLRKSIQSKAQSAIQYEVKRGAVIKPTECQVCNTKRKLLAHHWNGYNNPLDAWWICHPCHKLFPNHDGSVSLEQAKVAYSDWRLGKFQPPSA